MGWREQGSEAQSLAVRPNSCINVPRAQRATMARIESRKRRCTIDGLVFESSRKRGSALDNGNSKLESCGISPPHCMETEWKPPDCGVLIMRGQD